MTVKNTLNILEISSSALGDASKSRRLSKELIDALRGTGVALNIVRRDLRDRIPFVDESWVTANFTAPDERTAAQRQTLALSDELVAELSDADVLIIGVPIYNFSIPASLKAWVDLIARARLTFRYTEHGPVGLLENKKAYLVVASGGVPVGSPVDFATPYLRHALQFIGITDVDIIAAEKTNVDEVGAMSDARARIAELADRQLERRAS